MSFNKFVSVSLSSAWRKKCGSDLFGRRYGEVYINNCEVNYFCLVFGIFSHWSKLCCMYSIHI